MGPFCTGEPRAPRVPNWASVLFRKTAGCWDQGPWALVWDQAGASLRGTPSGGPEVTWCRGGTRPPPDPRASQVQQRALHQEP